MPAEFVGRKADDPTGRSELFDVDPAIGIGIRRPCVQKAHGRDKCLGKYVHRGVLLDADVVPGPFPQGGVLGENLIADDRRRFDAAQRTIALRWLAVLWKQRDRRVAEFTTQHDRVRAFFS
jgi:hypothetical protein